MAAVTLATAEAHRDAWLAADLALTRNQEYTLPDGRDLKRVKPAEVKERLSYWQGVVNALAAEAAGATNPGVKTAKWSTRR